MFEEHEGSYLVGAIAALKAKSGHIAFVGGMDIPLIRRFQLGFEEGVRKVNPKAKVQIGYIGVTSDTLSSGDVYDYANNLIAQRMSMISGVSQAEIYGSPRAIRIKAEREGWRFVEVPGLGGLRKIRLALPGRGTHSVSPGDAAKWFLPLADAEANLRWMNFRSLSQCLTSQTRPGSVTEADLAVYREAWYREGAVEAMLRYFAAPAAPAAKGEVRCPALVIRGRSDKSYSAAQVTNPTGGRVIDVDTGHFPHLDVPAEVSAALVDVLGTQEKRQEWRPPQW
jgi:hypothetical protein